MTAAETTPRPTNPRIVIVTGAAQGIGAAMAAAFVSLGDTVIGTDLNAEGLRTAAAAMPGPGAFHPVVADMGAPDDITASFDAVAAQHGRIDVLINNAGVTRRADLMELTPDDWDRIMRVNAKGHFFCLQRAAHHMLQAGSGRIINIASVAGRGYPDSSNAIYATSKGGSIALTRMAAHRLGPHGITVNAICPGITETEIFQGIVARDAEARGVPYDDVHAEKTAKVPVRRSNTCEEVADMAVYLASDAARNITGQSMHIDGGLVMV